MNYLPLHDSLASPRPVNAMSVDVEDYFQVLALSPHIARAEWELRECRIPANVERILETFATRNVRATFFVLGWVAERFPAVVRSIAAGGHEIASHGYEHVQASRQTPEVFRADVMRTRKILEDVSGQAVLGYRAASYSIGRDNLWALDVLQECGHRYSSSIYPVRHDIYGMPEAPRFAFRLRPDALLEIPVTTVRVAGRNFPCGGGGYFRLLPYALFRWALARVNQNDRQPGVFYFHPWEVDPQQPRVAGASWRSRFRHYTNLQRMHPRLERLLADFRWGRMDEVFAPALAA